MLEHYISVGRQRMRCRLYHGHLRSRCCPGCGRGFAAGKFPGAGFGRYPRRDPGASGTGGPRIRVGLGQLRHPQGRRAGRGPGHPAGPQPAGGNRRHQLRPTCHDRSPGAAGSFGCRADCGMEVIISVPEGQCLAAKTFNPRLGIEGGISILGSTGIVRPMSRQALVDTTRVEMEVHWAEGARDLLMTPGNYGADFAAHQLGLDMRRAVQCSNYIGDALDNAVNLGFLPCCWWGISESCVSWPPG